MKSIIFLFMISFFLFSCSLMNKQAKYQEIPDKKPNINSCELASAYIIKEKLDRFFFCDNFVVINAKKEMEGIRAEYEWIRKNYPGYERLAQGLYLCKDMFVDVIKIETKNGVIRNICFNINSFFGKW